MKKNYLLLIFFVLISVFRLYAQHDDNDKSNERKNNEPIAANQNKDYTVNWQVNPFNTKIFVENQGQFDGENNTFFPILFAARLGNIDAYFDALGITYRYQKLGNPKNKAEKEKDEKEREARGEEREDEIAETLFVRLTWLGANPNATVTGSEAETYYSTYPVGLDGTIKANVYRKIIYHDLYPGIDVEYVFPTDKEGIKYNLIVHRGADVSKVQLKYDGIDNMHLNPEGDVIVETEMGEFTDHAPICFYQEGESVAASYTLNSNVESFAFSKGYNHHKTLIVDPWTTNPAFGGTYNDAYEVDWDDQDNVYVYGTWGPSKLVKLNSSGVIQWTFNAVTINTDAEAQWGDFVVDKVTGTSYLVEGYNRSTAGGARSLKVRTNGTLAGTFTGNANFEEMDRVVYSACTRQLVIGGGGTNSINQGCMLDTTMAGFVPHNVLNADLPYHDMWLTAMDPSGTTVYMGSCNSCCNNNVAYDDRLLKLNVPALTASTFNLNIHAWTYMPEALSNVLYMTWSGVPANGFNGMAASKNFLFLFDGADLFKVNKTTGNLIVTRSGVATTMQSWGGLDVDVCDNVYVGSNSKISVFNGTTLASASAPTSTIVLPNTVYDVKLGKNYQKVYACGHTYVTSINITTPPVILAKIIMQPTCGSCNGTAKVNLTTCGVIDTVGATYLWSNGATTHTITGLCAGVYSVTVTPAGTCNHYSDTLTLVASSAPAVSASSPTICSGQSTTLTATGATSYTWMPGSLTGTSVIVSPTITTVYTVTGTSVGCTGTATVTVTVSASITPNFATIPAFCSGTTPPILGTTSPNSIIGTWNPATINNTTSGTYIFTPNTGQCATTQTLSVTVTPNVTPTFIALGPYCVGATPAALPATSTNGVSGTWNPTIIATTIAGTSTYTFTPTAGQCATTATMSVTITTSLTPTFTALGPYCIGAIPGSLPTTSTNSITGIWSPTNISTAVAGTIVYTFTPTAGQCAAVTSMSVTVSSNITPTFTALGPYCVGATPAALPNTSTNGITGTWNPVAISTATAGTLVYTFTPIGSTCASTATMSVTVNTQTIPNFAAISAFCSGAVAPILGTTSPNGITGTWNPAIISNTASGTYTFTPNAGQCSTTQTLNVTVNPQTISDFAAIPAFCVGSVAPILTTTAPNGVTGTWNPASISNTTSGTYTFTPNSGLCPTNQILNVTVLPPTVPDFAAIPAFCIGSVAPVLATTSLNGIIGTWNPASISNTTSGTYTFTPNAGQCASTVTLTTTVDPIPSVSATASPDSICFGATSTLTGSGASTYSWTPGSLSGTTVNVSPATSTIYTVVGSSVGGCTASASILVSLLSEAVLHFVALPNSGCAPLTVQFKIVYDGTIDTTTLHWDFGDPSTTTDVSNETSPIYTYNNSGDFIVTLTGVSTTGCNATGHDIIHVLPTPIANFFADPSITDMNFPLIHFYDESTNAYQWMWSFGDPHSNISFEQFPEHTYDAPGNYPVMLVVHNGDCVDTIIKYVLVRDAFTFYIPNTFSPTYDYHNDIFNGYGLGFKTDEFELYIYDRWGEKIFYTTDSEKGWDGKVQGFDKICQEGIYVYKFKVVELNGIEHKYIGIVLLLR